VEKLDNRPITHAPEYQPPIEDQLSELNNDAVDTG
jgi:hypothetical protein